jgi:hypothetical protein
MQNKLQNALHTCIAAEGVVVHCSSSRAAAAVSVVAAAATSISISTTSSVSVVTALRGSATLHTVTALYLLILKRLL